MDCDALVIGGGIAGLSAALELRRRGVDALLLEAGPEPGGHFRAERRDGYLFPWGPHAVPGFAHEAFELVERLGLSDLLVPAREASRRLVWLNGRRVALPSGPGSFLTSPFLSLGGKLRLMSEPWRRAPLPANPHESVSEFFGRRLGEEAVRNLIAPFVSGIYAGDPEQLEARSAFPKLVGWERAAGSLVRGALAARKAARTEGAPKTPRRRGLWSFAGGLAELADAVAARLGESVRCSSPVRSLVEDGEGWLVETEGDALRTRRIVLAVPPADLARLLKPVDAEAAELAAGVPTAPVAVVHLGGPVPAGARPPRGFGLLVPREAGLRTLGTVFASSLFPGRAPEGCWLQASYLGGVGDPGALELDDESLRSLVAEESRTLLGFDADGGVVRIFRHAAAIPQLVAGHAERVERLRERLRSHEGLFACGNWLTGVGLQHAIATGLAAGREAAA